MSEIIVKMNIVKIDDKHVKIKGGEYVRDIVRCKACKHWTKGDDVFGICYRCSNTRQMRYDDFCSYGVRDKDINVRSKTEPKPCEWCKFYNGEECYSQEPCKVKDEPQTERSE